MTYYPFSEVNSHKTDQKRKVTGRDTKHIMNEYRKKSPHRKHATGVSNKQLKGQ